MAVLVVLAMAGGAAAWWIARGDDDSDAGEGSGPGWNTVVVQNSDNDEITLADPEGEEIDSFPTDLTGLLDVGLSDRLVVGVAGQPSTDGLGVIDLDSGDVTELEVAGDTVARLDSSAYLLASGRLGEPVELVDVAAGEVTDLLDLATSSDPVVNASLVRIDPEHTHIAFTLLGELATLLVDLKTQKAVSLAGSLVDISPDAVLTITNRGKTSLVDLYGFDGERIGTVETDAAAGGLVLSDTTALIVTRVGSLVRVDFDDEKLDEIGSISSQLAAGDSADTGSVATGSSVDEPQVADATVRAAVPMFDRSRLVVLGQSAIVIIDLDGEVVAADRVAGATPMGVVTSDDRCVLLGAVDAEQTLWDTSDGTRIETFDAGFAIGRSSDACTITYVENPTGDTRAGDADDATRFVGPDVNRSVDAILGAVAPDGSAAVGWGGTGAFVLDAETGDRVELQTPALDGVFLDR